MATIRRLPFKMARSLMTLSDHLVLNFCVMQHALDSVGETARPRTLTVWAWIHRVEFGPLLSQVGGFVALSNNRPDERDCCRSMTAVEIAKRNARYGREATLRIVAASGFV